jgi:hypothetical protein
LRPEARTPTSPPVNVGLQECSGFYNWGNTCYMQTALQQVLTLPHIFVIAKTTENFLIQLDSLDQNSPGSRDNLLTIFNTMRTLKASLDSLSNATTETEKDTYKQEVNTHIHFLHTCTNMSYQEPVFRDILDTYSLSAIITLLVQNNPDHETLSTLLSQQLYSSLTNLISIMHNRQATQSLCSLITLLFKAQEEDEEHAGDIAIIWEKFVLQMRDLKNFPALEHQQWDSEEALSRFYELLNITPALQIEKQWQDPDAAANATITKTELIDSIIWPFVANDQGENIHTLQTFCGKRTENVEGAHSQPDKHINIVITEHIQPINSQAPDALTVTLSHTINDKRTFIPCRYDIPTETILFEKEYVLAAIAQKRGGENNGHYVSYRRARETWFEINDSTVTQKGSQTFDAKDPPKAIVNVLNNKHGYYPRALTYIRKDVFLQQSQTPCSLFVPPSSPSDPGMSDEQQSNPSDTEALPHKTDQDITLSTLKEMQRAITLHPAWLECTNINLGNPSNTEIISSLVQVSPLLRKVTVHYTDAYPSKITKEWKSVLQQTMHHRQPILHLQFQKKSGGTVLSFLCGTEFTWRQRLLTRNTLFLFSCCVTAVVSFFTLPWGIILLGITTLLFSFKTYHKRHYHSSDRHLSLDTAVLLAAQNESRSYQRYCSPIKTPTKPSPSQPAEDKRTTDVYQPSSANFIPLSSTASHTAACFKNR